ncbi:hypothetical protein [Parahaliea aestuarii]|uniref:Uncharacterized protein n=1 Tax=Parahaliea aestuarii TaxID=1852021 RepID=A0A5C8ZMY3_9GAMM|nr:hypothetical protein [Parahaliea aestuarii]TXS89114.1 hypothetical protein FVW59_18495 [Parahaliea aestuarii]
MEVLWNEARRRWRAMFETLQAGLDVPPGQRLRLEGLMEAIALLEPGCQDALQDAMDAQYQQVFGRSLGQDFGDQWRTFYAFPQIPAVMQRAPVWPSTADQSGPG